MRELRRAEPTYCKGNESGPAPKAGTLRDDMRAPLANRQSGYRYRMGIYGPALPGGTYIGKKIWALQRSDIFGMEPLANRQSGYRYRNGNIWARPSRRDIYREEDMDARQQRATYSEWNGIGMESDCRRAAQLVADGYGETQGYGGNGGDGA